MHPKRVGIKTKEAMEAMRETIQDLHVKVDILLKRFPDPEELPPPKTSKPSKKAEDSDERT